MLIQWQVNLINTAIINQYSYNRWKAVVTVMILKTPGDTRIHRLWAIHLYKQDYNLLLAIKWRALINQCNSNKIINKGQYGGIPGRNSVSPTVIKELQYEITRASKRLLFHLDYNATACYDRIVMNMAGLIARGFGQHRSIVFINGTTLEHAKYKLKTAFNVSESFFAHRNVFPICRSGQGAGNSPGVWGCISSVTSNCYKMQAYRAQFISPDKKLTVRIFMIGFLDDTSRSTNEFDSPIQLPLEHYIKRANTDAQIWNNILHTTGAVLNQKKCSYHFLNYEFTLSGIPFHMRY